MGVAAFSLDGVEMVGEGAGGCGEAGASDKLSPREANVGQAVGVVGVIMLAQQDSF